MTRFIHATFSTLPSVLPTLLISLAALLYQMKHGRRDAQPRPIEYVNGQFNVPPMRDCRKLAARKILERSLSVKLGKPTKPIRDIIDFFASIARDCRSGQVSINDVERTYRLHIQILCSSYPRYIRDRSGSKKHADLQWLVKRWGASESLAAGIPTVQKALLEAEAGL